MRYLATIFVISSLFSNCLGCPDTMTDNFAFGSPSLASGQSAISSTKKLTVLAQTFKSTVTGLLNAMMLPMGVTASTTITITFQTSGGTTLDTATTVVNNGDNIFVFPGLPLIEADSTFLRYFILLLADYQFTVSASGDVLLCPTFTDYGFGSLSGGSGDYYFQLETICKNFYCCVC